MDTGYTRIREKIPYAGKGVDQLVDTLRRLLSENRLAQKLVVEVGQPIILEKLVPAEEAPDGPSLHDIIRGKPMEDYTPEESRSPLHQLWDIFAVIHEEGLEVGFIVVGDKHAFQKWLGVRISVKALNVFGVPLVLSPQIPSDAFIVCGTSGRDATPTDIEFSVKGTIA